jgi:hypothetical protein
MLVWQAGDESWLVDGEGLLFASALAVDPVELGTGATGTELPVVDDRRSASSEAAMRPLSSQLFVVIGYFVRNGHFVLVPVVSSAAGRSGALS